MLTVSSLSDPALHDKQKIPDVRASRCFLRGVAFLPAAEADAMTNGFGKPRVEFLAAYCDEVAIQKRALTS